MAPVLEQAVSWVAEGIDYEPLPCRASGSGPLALERHAGVRERYWHMRSVLKVASTVVAAVAIGATAAVMHVAVDSLIGRRNAVLRLLFARSLLQAYGAQLAMCCGLALAAAAAVQYVAPRAAGGGVTWVMAWLNGNDVHGLFTPRVFLVKWAGSVAALGASLCLGLEAPMVHLGACLASLVSASDKRVWGALCRSRWLHRLARGARAAAEGGDSHSTVHLLAGSWWDTVDQRDSVSAGAAAGIAAAFGAPIGGVLFSLEEATTVWSKQIAWRCFLASAVAVIAHASLHPADAGGLLAAPLQPLAPAEWLRQLPAVAAVSAGGGLLGAAFNKLRMAVRPWRAKPKKHSSRIREVVLVTALTVSTIAALAASVGSCLPVPPHWAEGAEGGEAQWVQHSCPEGQYNDLATAWLGPPVWSLRTLISLGTEQEPEGRHHGGAAYYTPASLAAMVAGILPLMGLSAALAIPGGLFMPSLLLGGSFGALCGLGLRAAAPPGWHVQPGLYALCAATAVLGGVFRSSISVVVLVTESCGTLAPLIGTIVAVIVSNAVAVLLGTEGVYESELENELRLNYLAQAPPRRLRGLTAEHLMSGPVVGLPAVVSVQLAENLMRYSQHNGFPVYAPRTRDPQDRTFRLAGLILRSQVELLLRERAHCDAHGRYLNLPSQAGGDAEAYEDALAAAMSRRLEHCPSGSPLAGSSGDLASVGRTGSSGGAAAFEAHPSPFDNQVVVPHLNLQPFVNPAPMCVRPDTPATRVHRMFVSLSLRHIVVADERNHALGMITRRDLAHAAGSRLTRSGGAGGSGRRTVDLDSLLERPLERPGRAEPV